MIHGTSGKGWPSQLANYDDAAIWEEPVFHYLTILLHLSPELGTFGIFAFFQ